MIICVKNLRVSSILGVYEEERRKDVTELENTLSQSEWADAEAEEAAIAASKPAPKTRANTQRHLKAIADAKHRHRVCQIATERRHRELLAALEAHGADWKAETAGTVGEFDAKWSEAVSSLVKLHGERSQAVRITKAIGVEHASIGALGFARRQVQGVEYASGQGNAKGWIAIEDVLAGLADLGQPEPPAPEPVQHPPLKPMQNRSGREQTEQREFLEHLDSPEGRRQVEEARRQRAELLRQQGDAALQASLES